MRRRVWRFVQVHSTVSHNFVVDPQQPNQADRVSKLRNQQEVSAKSGFIQLLIDDYQQRQTLAYILVRQVIGLLQRTKLNVTVSCQAWHAKNARHMLLGVLV